MTISLVEENDDLRASFAALLNGAPGLRCVSSYGSAEEALQEIPNAPPDVVLMDIHLRGMSGIECMTRLKTQLPALRVLMLARHEHGDLGFDSIRAGADGCLLKRARAATLFEAIEQVHEGGAPITMQIARKILDFVRAPRKSRKPGVLAPHEQEVIGLIARGFSHKETGTELGISPAAVRACLNSVYRKLRGKSREQLL